MSVLLLRGARVSRSVESITVRVEKTNSLQETRSTRILAKPFPDREKLAKKQVIVRPSEQRCSRYCGSTQIPSVGPVTPSSAKSRRPHRQLSSVAGHCHAQAAQASDCLMWGLKAQPPCFSWKDSCVPLRINWGLSRNYSVGHFLQLLNPAPSLPY